MRIVADEATRDRYRGCLLGGAIGAVKEGLEGHVPLALFTAEGLLRGWVSPQAARQPRAGPGGRPGRCRWLSA